MWMQHVSIRVKTNDFNTLFLDYLVKFEKKYTQIQFISKVYVGRKFLILAKKHKSGMNVEYHNHGTEENMEDI